MIQMILNKRNKSLTTGLPRLRVHVTCVGVVTGVGVVTCAGVVTSIGVVTSVGVVTGVGGRYRCGEVAGVLN